MASSQEASLSEISFAFSTMRMAASVSEAGTAQARRAARLRVEMASGRGRGLRVDEGVRFFGDRKEED